MIRVTLDDLEYVNACIGRDFPGANYAEVLAEPLHVVLMEEGSGAVFAWRGPQTYEVHLFFDVRGRAAIDLLQRMFQRMRIIYDARHFWALVPVEDRKVKLFARWMGWIPQGVMNTRGGVNELFVSEKCGCHL